MNHLKLTLLLTVLCFRTAQAQRTVEQALHSADFPPVTLKVSSDLPYLGTLTYDVGGVAQAEEQIFATVERGRLQQVFIAHFEHFLSTNNHVFNYPTLRMARLGHHEYLHQTWAIRDFDLFHVPALVDFLRSRGLQADTSWLVDRYVRVVDSARKHEVIFFYLEPATLNDPAIHYGGAPFEPPPPPPPPPAIEHELTRRAAKAFQIVEDP